MLTFVKLKGLLGRRDEDEIGEAKSAVIALKGRFGPEATSELEIIALHLEQNSYDKAAESFLSFRGVIGDSQPPPDTF